MPLWELYRYGSILTRPVCSRAETVLHTPTVGATEPPIPKKSFRLCVFPAPESV